MDGAALPRGAPVRTGDGPAALDRSSRGFAIPAPVPRGAVPAWVRHYIGLPFQDLGRDRHGVDCWGLVRLVARERFGIEMPLWDGGYPGCDIRDMRAMATHVASALPLFAPVMVPADGDVVLVRVANLPVHVGLVVAPGWMLHAAFGRDCVVETIVTQTRPETAIEGFYRWRGVA